jgi:hypothetical protein
MMNRAVAAKFQYALVCLSFLLSGAVAHAGTVTGTIRNGTNDNKPAAGVDVVLIQLQGGMQSVATTKSDAGGRYKLDSPAIGSGPMLIRAIYRGVNYHQPLTPGTASVDVTVFEPTSDPKAIQIPLRLLVFQPSGDKLMIGEEYSVKNDTKPPAAYYKQDGNFDFTIPAGSEIGQASTFGPSGMPVKQGTIDKGKGKYAIAYAFQPGQNGVRISYQLPYAGDHATLHVTSPYSADKVLLVIPPSMQISSPGFNAAGTEQGFNVFAKDAVKAGTSFDVTVSGTAPPPSDSSSSNNGAPDQVNGRDSGPAPTIEVAPARLDDQKWVLLGGLAAIFAVGVGLLLRKPVPVPAAAPAETAAKSRKQQRAAAKVANPVKTAPAPAAEAVQKDVNSNLESLKDTLLRIELKRQAGTISDEEYSQERGRAEQLLRDLVQG